MTGAPTAVAVRSTPSFRACCALVSFVFGVTWLQSWLNLHHLAVATVYFGNGVFLAALYIVDRPMRFRMLAAMFLALAGGTMAAGRPPGLVIVMASILAGQAGLGATVLRRLAPDGLDFTKARAFGNLALVALVVAPPSGYAIEQLLIHVNPMLLGIQPDLVGSGTSGPVPSFIRAGLLTAWMLPHALGILLGVPLTIGFATPLRQQYAAWWSSERALILAVNFVAAAAIFWSDGHSYLFLICPPLVWAGLRLGVRDTASAILISLAIASVATALGHGPAEVLQTNPDNRRLFLELAYLCACACVMPIAASLEARRRLEADLASSLEFSGQILSNMHEIVFRTDDLGNWTFLNPAWEQITGYTVAETLGRNYSQLLVADDRAKSASVLSGLVGGDIDEIKLQQRIHCCGGEIRDVEISARAFRSADGLYLGTTGTIRDMSEYRRYVAALESSERRFRDLCDTAPIGIARTDLNGMITYANQKLELIASLGREQLIGVPWLDNRSDHPNMKQDMTRALRTPTAVFEQELNFRDRPGVDQWLIITSTGEFNADAELIGFISAISDITARKVAEAELACSTSELRLLADNISDLIFRLGPDRTYRYASSTVREVMGLDPEQLIGTIAFTLAHPDDRQVIDDAFERIASGAIRHCSFIFRAMPVFPEADYIWFEANCHVLRDDAGNPCEVVVATRDITERKQLELSIIEARERAEQATLAKSAFIANLSHEIRTPMNGVIGLTELLLTRELDGPSRRYATLISESGAAMMHLLNDILDIAKIDSGRLQITSEEFDLHRCLANSLSLMQASAGSKKLDLRLDIAPDVPRMMLGDSLRLRQVLANLIGNALKFTEIGHVTVDCRRDGQYLEVRVTDTGIGIAADQIAGVFEEFVQANSQIFGSFGGTGLGLSISRRIAEAMGGALTLTSQPGTGTCVILRIPATFIAVPIKVGAVSARHPPERPERPLRVLVAEDNRTNQIIINGMLQRLGHSAVLAETGVEVIALVEQAAQDGTPFDLVLMDLQMPEMGGIEATGRLRALGFDAVRLPIIAVTASGYVENIADCLAAGMQDHLTKPMRLADVRAALAALGRREIIAGAPLRSPVEPRQIEISNDP